MLDDRYRHLLGDPISRVSVATASMPIRAELFAPPEMLLRNAPLCAGRPVLSLDLGPVSSGLGFTVSGIIGVPFLSDRLMFIEPDEGVVKFLPHGPSPMRFHETAIDLAVDAAGRLSVPGVTVGDIKASFVLDTGMFGGGTLALSVSTFRRLVDRGLIDSVHLLRTGSLGGETVVRAGILKEMRLGPFVHRGVRVSESNENRLGLGYLSRFRTILDVPNQRMYLAKGKNYGTQDGDGWSGLRLLWIDGRVVVTHVEVHSAAEQAGILAGDVLLELNGQQADGHRLLQMRSTLEGASGTKIQMVLLRNGEKQRRDVTLRVPGS